jgi:prepilin-type N-terminal cleavage/methylation domain-containing protein
MKGVTMINSNEARKGFSLIETLVVIAIIAILIGLLIPAVSKVRSAALAIKSKNNHKQMALGFHNLIGEFQDRFPDNDCTIGGRSTWSQLDALLPYIEQNNLAAYMSQVYADGNFQLGTHVIIPLYLSPQDFTIPSDTGVSSYAVNSILFNCRKVESVRDGLSNTIMISEKYSYCGLATTSWYMTNKHTSPRTGMSLRGPHFCQQSAGDVMPAVANGVAVPSVPGLTFQRKPKIEECDPRILQSNSEHLLVAFADGSVRSLSHTISSANFWGMITPDGGEVVAE